MSTFSLRVALFLFGSGFCALVYQVTWLRLLRLIFGASTAASAAVLAIFMGGLGLGGYLLGRRADRSPNPLFFYGTLEISPLNNHAILGFIEEIEPNRRTLRPLFHDNVPRMTTFIGR